MSTTGPVYRGQDPRATLDALMGELRNKLCDSGPTSDEEATLIRAANTASMSSTTDDIQQSVAELQEALQKFAPPYHYFGAHPDDPALIGYWPDWEGIMELPMARSVELAQLRYGDRFRFRVDDPLTGRTLIYNPDGTLLVEVQ